jgi:hypothetical protein
VHVAQQDGRRPAERRARSQGRQKEFKRNKEISVKRGAFRPGWSEALEISCALVLLLVATATSSLAQDDDKKLGWSFEAELAAIWAGGNSEASTYGVEATGRRVWERSMLKLVAGGAQTQTSLTTRTAVGTSQEDYTLTVDKRTEKTAEFFYGRARFDRSVSKQFHFVAGVDWLRNTFAGIDSRTLVGLGAANIWRDTDALSFETNYAFTYTFQQEVVENPFTKNEFPGVRVGYNLEWQLTDSTRWLSTIAIDWNLDNTDDVRINASNSLPVSISERLQLKPSLQLLWRNDPALASVDLQSPGGGSSGTSVLVPLDELDTLFTMALVVKL